MLPVPVVVAADVGAVLDDLDLERCTLVGYSMGGYMALRTAPDEPRIRALVVGGIGDTSPKGLQQSAGIMVNYLYRLSEIEANHEAYRGEGRVAASSTIRNLLRAG